jgi:hypothetical protein
MNGMKATNAHRTFANPLGPIPEETATATTVKKRIVKREKENW